MAILIYVSQTPGFYQYAKPSTTAESNRLLLTYFYIIIVLRCYSVRLAVCFLVWICSYDGINDSEIKRELYMQPEAQMPPKTGIYLCTQLARQYRIFLTRLVAQALRTQK